MTLNSSDLSNDPRWRRFHERNWICPTCNEPHTGVFNLCNDRPYYWSRDEKKQPNSAVDTQTNFLSEDFCILENEHYFIRGFLEIPIIGTDVTFAYGIWASLSKTNFDFYVKTFNSGEVAGLGPWFGWFSNQMQAYPETLNLKCSVYPQENRNRPHVKLQPTDHPLAIEQQNGITFDRLLEIYALNGHDFRSALTD